MLQSDLQNKLVGAKINWIKRTCDLIMLDITCLDGTIIYLHVLSFFRIIKNKKVILSSLDMYKRGSKAKKLFHWDTPNTSLFDDDLKNIESITYLIPIDKLIFYNDDFSLYLNNGMRIDIIIDTTENEEKYRFFNKTNDFLVVES